MQREGKYPPPKGVTNILGLEAAGYIVDSPEEVSEEGKKRVMCLLPGGGYAEFIKVDKRHVVELPQDMSWE